MADAQGRTAEDFGPSTPDEVKAGKTNMIILVERGHVIQRFPQPMPYVVMEPQNAFQIGEAMARAAHEAKFGTAPVSDGSYIAEQVRARVTEELRDAMVARVALVLPQLIERKWTPGKTALEVVDICLSMAQGKTV